MVCRVTPAARAMSSTLAPGSAFRVSVAACRIAAMLCLASDRCRLRLACGCADPSAGSSSKFDNPVRANLALTPVYEKSGRGGSVMSVAPGRPDPRSGPAIEAEGLEKRFGSTRGLAGVDLQVAQGAVYGLLGP